MNGLPQESAGETQQAPPKGACIDELIRWLQHRRLKSPTGPLSEVVDFQDLSPDMLVELLAVDLIGQRRRGLDALVEDYLSQFPALSASESSVLDLIDAELCVRREMGEQKEAPFFIARFPELADAIRQLVYLEYQPGGSCEVAKSSMNTAPLIEDAVEGLQDYQQRDMTVAGVSRRVSIPLEEMQTDDSIDVPIPIKPPPWVVAVRCLSTGQSKCGRHWLIKGRDSERGDAVGMKIIPLPKCIGRTERTRILDLCEMTSSVSHPSWIAPRIAAINHDHLAVVRPWVFGRTFGIGYAETDPKQRFDVLVRIAFALSAAHRIGATHGSVSGENILIDHESKVNLVDAASGVSGWEHYLATWSNDLAGSLDARIHHDTCGLLHLIAAECIRSSVPARLGWIARVCQGVDFSNADACVQIGESLQSLLDRPPRTRSWWR